MRDGASGGGVQVWRPPDKNLPRTCLIDLSFSRGEKGVNETSTLSIFVGDLADWTSLDW